MLVACGSKEADVAVSEAGTSETEDIVIDTAEDANSKGVGMSNPWVECGDDIGCGTKQMNFTMENAMWVYRVQTTEALEDISGIYCEWDYTGETKVAGMDAMEYSYASETESDYIDDMECTRVINWYDKQNKLTYSLSVMGTDLNGMDTAVYAENLLGLAVEN